MPPDYPVVGRHAYQQGEVTAEMIEDNVWQVVSVASYYESYRRLSGKARKTRCPYRSRFLDGKCRGKLFFVMSEREFLEFIKFFRRVVTCGEQSRQAPDFLIKQVEILLRLVVTVVFQQRKQAGRAFSPEIENETSESAGDSRFAVVPGSLFYFCLVVTAGEFEPAGKNFFEQVLWQGLLFLEDDSGDN